jgi:hypothetical protein
MAAILVIRRGEGAGSEHPLDGEVVIGRERGSADLVLDDPGVSRRHAAVRAEGSRIIVADLGSSNGTYANGRRITGTAVLADGDEIELGGTTISVHARAPAVPALAPGGLGPAPGRRQPSGVAGRLDDEGNVPALAAAFLGPLSIFLLIASTGAAFFASLPCAIAAIVLGKMGQRRVDRGEADSHRTLASIGRITGIVGTVLSLLAIAAWLALVLFLDAAGDGLREIIDSVSEELEDADAASP